MGNRLEAVVADIVEGIRGALTKHNVTFDEYRQGIGYVMKTVEAGELPLLIDAFLNTTICQIENRNFGGSLSTLEGPYFLDDAPFVDGALKTYRDDRHEPLLLRGRVIDEAGKPIVGAVIDIWHSTPDGHYGGFQNDIPRDFYRGKLRADEAGRYQVRTTYPSPTRSRARPLQSSRERIPHTHHPSLFRGRRLCRQRLLRGRLHGFDPPRSAREGNSRHRERL
jgi:chlorocatechol 1,2-dioxygenase